MREIAIEAAQRGPLNCFFGCLGICMLDTGVVPVLDVPGAVIALEDL